jgi:hypothetical protein
MAGERVAEGILGAFFGSFIGAPLGVQAAGLVTNLLASGIYSVCGGVAQSLKTRGNHNIQELAAASLRAAVEEGKRENGAAWGPAAVMRLDELHRDTEAVLIAMETEESRQLVEALLVGRPAGMTEVVGRLVGTYIQKQCHDWDAVQKDLAPRFFQHFREKYVHPDFAAARQALERDVAWATLQQGETIQALVVSLGAGMAEQFEKFQAQLNRIESQADRCDTSGLCFAWIEDYFLKVSQQLARMEEKQDQSLAQGNRIEETLAQMRAILAISPEELARLRGMEQEVDALRAELAAKEAKAATLAAQLPAGAGLEAEALAATANGDYREAERLYALIDEEKTREAARIKQQRGDNAFRAHHWMDAARLYAEAYDLDPTDERNDQCGVLYALIGQSGSALPYLDRRVQRFFALRAQLEPQGQWSPEYRNDLAAAYVNRGVAQQGVPDLNAAIKDYDAAIEIMDGLGARLEPQGQWNPQYRNDLAAAYTNRGLARQDISDLNAAIQDHGAAIEMMEGLRQDLEPQGQWKPKYRNDLAGAYINRGNAQRALLDLNSAIQDCGAAIAIMEGLRQALEPQGQWNPQYRNDLARAYVNRGNTLHDVPYFADFGAAIAIMEDLRTHLEPQGQWSPSYRNDLAAAYMNRAFARQVIPNFPDALQDFETAIQIMEDLRGILEPKQQWSLEYRFALAKAYINRAFARQVIPDFPVALQDVGTAIQIIEELTRLQSLETWPACFSEIYRLALTTRAAAHRALGHDDLAAEDVRRAREIPD